MDCHKLKLRQRRSESGFAIIIVVGVIAIVIGAICLLSLKISAQTIRTVRQNEFTAEIESRAKRASDMAKTDLVNTVANSMPKYVQGQQMTSYIMSQMSQFMKSGLQNVSTDDNLSTEWWGSWGNNSAAWTNVAMPAGTRRLFGNRSTFVGRLLTNQTWQEHADYDTSQRLQSYRYKTKDTSLYEFPANSFAASGNRVFINGSAVAGSVLAGWLELRGSAVGEVDGGATVYRRLTTDGNTQISGVTLPQIDSTAGPKLAKQLQSGYLTGGKDLHGQISVFRGVEEEAMMILTDMTRDSEGIPQMFRKITGRTPSNIEKYFLPAYQCRVRIVAQMVADGTQVGGYRCQVTLYSADFSNPPVSVSTETQTSTFTLYPNGASSYGLSLQYSTTGSTTWNLVFDPTTMADWGITAGSYYIDFLNAAGARTGSHFVVLKTYDPALTPLSSFSLVTPNFLKLSGTFNSTNKPISIFAPEVRFGVSGAPSSVQLTGQRSTLDATGALAIDTVKNYDGSIYSSNKTVTLSDITDPTKVPPVNVKGWMLLVRDSEF